MSKKYITIGLLAGLTAGTGAGLILQQTGAAGASAPAIVQQDDTSTDDTSTDDTSTTSRRPAPASPRRRRATRATTRRGRIGVSVSPRCSHRSSPTAR
jgi:hypothetical protein